MPAETLTTTLTVPKPKFSKGDVLRIRPGSENHTSNFDLIGWVKKVSFHGSWWLDPVDGTISTTDAIGPLYEIVIQGGVSGSITTSQEKMRPGTYLTGFSEDGEHDALELVTDWALPIVSEDTIDNIGERVEVWKKKLLEEGGAS